MKLRKQKKRLRSASKQLSHAQMRELWDTIQNRYEAGYQLNELEKKTLKILSKEMRKRENEFN